MTVLELIKDPSRRVALVVQGGGMRAVYSAAVLGCFDQYKLQDYFCDAVGSSAGAVNAAYFLAHQPAAINVYIDALSNKNFVDYTRKKIVNIDYLVDVALHQGFPLDINKLKLAKTKLHVILTSATSGRRFAIDNPLEFADIYEEFRATTALPIFYDQQVPIRHRLFIDGGVADLIPVIYTASLKPTDIIVIMNKPLHSYRAEYLHEKLGIHLIQKLARRQSQAVKKLLPTSSTSLKKNIHAIARGSYHGTAIHLLAPPEELPVGTATIDRQKLEQAAEQGWQDAEAFLLSEVTGKHG